MIKRFAAVMLLILGSSSIAVADCDRDITKTVLADVAFVNKYGKLGKTLVASTAAGEVKPALIDWALRMRTKTVAEELVSDFRDRNAEPMELDAKLAAPFALIKLEDYSSGGAVDWARVEADFPGTQTIVKLSRPGCDSLEGFAVQQLQYLFRKQSNVPESVLFHVVKEPKGWKVELRRMGSQEAWDKSDCAHHTLPLNPDYPDMCKAFISASR